MRVLAILSIIATLAWTGGCQPVSRPYGATALSGSASNAGLSLDVTVPARTACWGDTMEVIVIARNTSRRDIVINADSQAPVLVTISRRTSVGWRKVLEFPRSSVRVANLWTLTAGGARAFTLELPVERDWPTGEDLRLTAQLNGRPDVAPGVIIYICPAVADPEPARAR